MANTELDLANAALGLIGEAPLSSFSDDRPAATAIQSRLPNLRDALLRSHPWNFAVTRAQLSRLAAAPDFGFAHAYMLPDDYLRLMAVNDGRDNFQIERFSAMRVLLSDADAIDLRYIARITSPGGWDALFYEAMAAILALDLASSVLKGDTESVQRTRALALERVALARSIDGQENPPGEIFTDDFIEAFLGGSVFRPIADPT